ncbi:MAG: serine/threonine protein kinase [Myxococcales bacterium]|nr:serine/threonine protein kinase [Myxococcales bacterium]
MTERKIGQLAGRVLAGRYELVKVIGDGGMGRVYRGVQLSTGGRVAIKVLDAWDHDAATVKRFRYEAETTASLSHPNTVRILDFGSDDDLFFLVMEYLPGTDLTRYLRREGQSDPFVAHVLLQVACSLAEAHSRGLVHRDIKPNNVMLLHHAGLPSFVKVIDFGIARAIDGPGNGTMGILGTMGYIAPEQMKDGIQPDARTDLYSLGCVAYELLSGRLPFDGITHNSPPMDVLEAHLRGKPTPLEVARPGTHPRLAELVMSLIRKEPGDRPPAAGELIEPLYDLRRQLSPELAFAFDTPVVGSAPSKAAAQPAAPTPAGTAAYTSPGSLSEPPSEPAAASFEAPPAPDRVSRPPADPFAVEEEEDDEDVISSVSATRRARPDQRGEDGDGADDEAGAEGEATTPPDTATESTFNELQGHLADEGEAEATAGKTQRISHPPEGVDAVEWAKEQLESEPPAPAPAADMRATAPLAAVADPPTGPAPWLMVVGGALAGALLTWLLLRAG